MNQTSFIEANVLLTMAEGDTETAEEILEGMTDAQIEYLSKAALATMQICSRILRQREDDESQRAA